MPVHGDMDRPLSHAVAGEATGSGSGPSPGSVGTGMRPSMASVSPGYERGAESKLHAFEHRRRGLRGEQVHGGEEAGTEARGVRRHEHTVGFGQCGDLAPFGDATDLGDVGLGDVDRVTLEQASEVEERAGVLSRPRPAARRDAVDASTGDLRGAKWRPPPNADR